MFSSFPSLLVLLGKLWWCIPFCTSLTRTMCVLLHKHSADWIGFSCDSFLLWKLVEYFQATPESDLSLFIVFGCRPCGCLTGRRPFRHTGPLWLLTPCDHPPQPCPNLWGERWWTHNIWVVTVAPVSCGRESLRAPAAMVWGGGCLKLPGTGLRSFLHC